MPHLFLNYFGFVEHGWCTEVSAELLYAYNCTNLSSTICSRSIPGPPKAGKHRVGRLRKNLAPTTVSPAILGVEIRITLAEVQDGQTLAEVQDGPTLAEVQGGPTLPEVQDGPALAEFQDDQTPVTPSETHDLGSSM